MALKGKTIRSHASGLKGQITGIENGSLKVTFTGVQDVSIPLDKAAKLLDMDKETLQEIEELLKSSGFVKKESKVQTYMDNFEEEEEEEENEEEPPVQMEFDDVE